MPEPTQMPAAEPQLTANKRGEVLLRDPDGSLSWVAPGRAGEAINSGYQPAEYSELQEQRDAKKYGDMEVQATAAALARGVSFGTSDLAATTLGIASGETLEKLKTYNPALDTAADIAGTGLGMLIPGGPAARLAAGTTKAGTRAAGRVASMMGRESTALVPQLAGRGLALGAEGAAYGAGAGIGEASRTAETPMDAATMIAEHTVKGAALGGGFGAGSALAAKGLLKFKKHATMGLDEVLALKKEQKSLQAGLDEAMSMGDKVRITNIEKALSNVDAQVKQASANSAWQVARKATAHGIAGAAAVAMGAGAPAAALGIFAAPKVVKHFKNYVAKGARRKGGLASHLSAGMKKAELKFDKTLSEALESDISRAVEVVGGAVEERISGKLGGAGFLRKQNDKRVGELERRMAELRVTQTSMDPEAIASADWIPSGNAGRQIKHMKYGLDTLKASVNPPVLTAEASAGIQTKLDDLLQKRAKFQATNPGKKTKAQLGNLWYKRRFVDEEIELLQAQLGQKTITNPVARQSIIEKIGKYEEDIAEKVTAARSTYSEQLGGASKKVRGAVSRLDGEIQRLKQRSERLAKLESTAMGAQGGLAIDKAVQAGREQVKDSVKKIMDNPLMERLAHSEAVKKVKEVGGLGMAVAPSTAALGAKKVREAYGNITDLSKLRQTVGHVVPLANLELTAAALTAAPMATELPAIAMTTFLHALVGPDVHRATAKVGRVLGAGTKVARAGTIKELSGEDIDMMMEGLTALDPADAVDMNASQFPLTMDLETVDAGLKAQEEALGFLKEKVPQAGRKASPIDRTQFKRYLTATSDPEGAIQRISQGKGRAEDIETLERVYPMVLAMLRQMAQAEVAQLQAQGDEPSGAVQSQMDMLMGNKRRIYNPDLTRGAEGQPGPGRPPGSGKGKSITTDRRKTRLQRAQEA